MNMAELTTRLEKLERDNRRMKRLGIAAAVIVVALGIMAATRPMPDVIKAHEFDVLDLHGRIRATVRSDAIKFFDRQGKCRAEMGKYSGGPSFLTLTENTGTVQLGSLGVGLPTQAVIPAIWLADASHRMRAGILIDSLQLSDTQGYPHVVIADEDGRPSIELHDSQGFGITLGSTSTQTLATGERQQTSAASIVMFGNDKKHHVIWHAP